MRKLAVRLSLATVSSAELYMKMTISELYEIAEDVAEEQKGGE